jgi:hypothetical protein
MVLLTITLKSFKKLQTPSESLEARSLSGFAIPLGFRHSSALVIFLWSSFAP